jgi:hypothetical protein
MVPMIHAAITTCMVGMMSAGVRQLLRAFIGRLHGLTAGFDPELFEPSAEGP